MRGLFLPSIPHEPQYKHKQVEEVEVEGEGAEDGRFLKGFPAVAGVKSVTQQLGFLGGEACEDEHACNRNHELHGWSSPEHADK